MATLVRFVKDQHYNEVIAVFPQLKYNRPLYGDSIVTCYAHIGQHSSCTNEWAKKQPIATPDEYKNLKDELEQIGYVLKVCKK